MIKNNFLFVLQIYSGSCNEFFLRGSHQSEVFSLQFLKFRPKRRSQSQQCNLKSVRNDFTLHYYHKQHAAKNKIKTFLIKFCRKQIIYLSISTVKSILKFLYNILTLTNVSVGVILVSINNEVFLTKLHKHMPCLFVYAVARLL